ncbi:MAG: hypothetical protein M1834_007213 [Cirrosporium novae-zelandiae]|nr:MAG: hypothetical protein M1834_007213 [Cirrosporium novae-zelandiae]
MEKKYRYPNVPRFAKEDAAKACHKLQNVKVWKDVVFGDIWARKEVCSMTALEENVFQTWYYGRIVCIGDSMHKMTPNLGQGANSAIESAAALANALQNLANIKRSEHPTDAEINGILGGFNRLRLTRMIDISKTSRFVTRFQARDGTFNKLFGRYLVPLAKDLPADMSSKTIAGGVMLKYLPRPKRSGTGWDLFHPSEPRWIHQILKVSVFFVLVATLVRILKIYGIY